MKGDEDVTVHAIVRVELEIEASGTWGGDCKMSQVYDQARDSAYGALEQMARERKFRILPGYSIVAVRAVAARKAKP